MIRETAREMARHRPATLVHPGRHATWYGDDAQRSRGDRAAQRAARQLGTQGRLLPAGQHERAARTRTRPTRSRETRQGRQSRTTATRSPSEAITTGIREATITGQPYPVKGWIVYATNLLQALPNEAETIQAIQALDLLVVVDVVASEIAGWADVVLPESTYLERYDDLNVELFREPFVALRQPVVEPPARPEAQLVDRARARGEARPRAPTTRGRRSRSTSSTRLDGRGPQPRRAQAEGRRPRRRSRRSTSRRAYAPDLPDALGEDRVLLDAARRTRASTRCRSTRRRRPPPGSFRLLFGRAPVHTFCRTQTNPLLAEAMAENEVWVNADVARARWGSRTATACGCENQDGVVSQPVKVKATERIRADCVYMVHGFGHTAKGLTPRARARARATRSSSRATRPTR